MASIAIYGADLLFASRIETQLRPLGHEVRRVPVERPQAADLAVCNVETVDPEWAVATLRPAVLLGFGSHEQPAALQSARRAGFDRVAARSAVAERLPALVEDLLGPAARAARMPPPRDRG